MADEPIGLGRLLPAQIDPDTLIDRLRSVIDPELGIDIVDLGLVYGATMSEGVVHVRMTTTTPACPIGSYLADSIRRALFELDGVLDVDIDLIYEPRWSPVMMSDEAKVELGWLQ
ncbi:MAG: metal-sulfur cluster assembly factor [Candidatus Limnocylindrales bacterium]